MKITPTDNKTVCRGPDGKRVLYRSLLRPWLEAEGLIDQGVIDIETIDEHSVRITCGALNERGRRYLDDDDEVALAPPRVVSVTNPPPAPVPWQLDRRSR